MLFFLLLSVFPEKFHGEIHQLRPLGFVPAEEEEAAEPDFGADLEGEHGLYVVLCLRPRSHDGQGHTADILHEIKIIVFLHTAILIFPVKNTLITG